MSVKLEPCPFCGSENTDPSFARGVDIFGAPTIGAGCMDCGACGPMVGHMINSTGYKEAAEPWNMRAQLAALKEENERLKLENKQLASPNLKSMHLEGSSLDVVLEGGASALLIQAFAQQFKDQSLGNYFELQFYAPEIGAMTVTLQRVNGETPGMKAGRLSAECDALKARVAELEGTLIKKIRIVMANVRNISRPKTTPNWNLYMHLFGCGSTSAIRGCQKIGLDPDGCKSSLNASIKDPANEG